MPHQVIPVVSLILPCDEAVHEIAAESWVVVNPWTTTQELPRGKAFPHRVPEVWIYSQLSGGLGIVDLAIEVLEVREDGTRRQVGISGAVRKLEFDLSNQLVPLVTAFRLKKVPFRSEGTYEFRLVAAQESGQWIALNGPTAQVRLLEHWGTP